MKPLVLAVLLQIRAVEQKIRAAAAAQHAALELVRVRERDGVRLVKSSAADPETVHQELIALREKSRRERRWARAARSAERARLLATLRRLREEMRALRKARSR